MIPESTKKDLVSLVTTLVVSEDWREYRPGGACHDPEDGDAPSTMMLTVATNDGETWGYQTGDNSFTGGAYGSRHWAVVYLSEESAPLEVVNEIVSQWEELIAAEE